MGDISLAFRQEKIFELSILFNAFGNKTVVIFQLLLPSVRLRGRKMLFIDDVVASVNLDEYNQTLGGIVQRFHEAKLKMPLTVSFCERR